jgi:hypothetical protein
MLLAPARTSQHGCTRAQRSTRATVTLTLLALLVSAVGPAVAGANSLLSGYGGPGQGNQAILGAALVGGRSGGGSTGGGSGSGGSGGESPSGLALAEGRANRSHPSEARVRARGAGRATAGGGAAVTGRQITGGASNSGARPYPHASSVNASQAASGSSPALGLSGADALYILLALGVLILTAVLTRRLARQPG